MEYYLVINKEETINTHKNLDESSENYAKWKKPIQKVTYVSIYTTFLKW